MADQVQHFACTIPPGTPIATPVVIPMRTGNFQVDQINVTVPPGPRGTAGFRITSDGTGVIPAAGAAWVVDDGIHLSYPLTGQPTSGQWEFVGYNLGNFPHTFPVTFYLALLTAPSGLSIPSIIPAVDLSSSS